MVRPGAVAFDLAPTASSNFRSSRRGVARHANAAELLWNARFGSGTIEGTGTVTAETSRALGLVAPRRGPLGSERERALRLSGGIFRFARFPRVDMDDGRMFAARAYVRWARDPAVGGIHPATDRRFS